MTKEGTERKSMTSRNVSIDYARLICSILVVGIHTAVFADFSASLSTIATQTVGRIAVPFFFVVSGFFYNHTINRYVGSEKFENNIYIYIWRQARLYLIWSFFAFIETIVFSVINHQPIIQMLSRFLLGLFVTGTTDPMWFFPALLYSELLVLLFKRMKAFGVLCGVVIILYVAACLLTSYAFIFSGSEAVDWLLSTSWFNPFKRIFMIGLPFVVLGCAASEYLGSKISELRSERLFFTAIVLLIAEAVFVWRMTDSLHISQSFFLPLFVLTAFLFLLTHPGRSKNMDSRYFRNLSTFVYLFHPFVIDCILFCNRHVFSMPITETPRFFITLSVSVLFGLAVMRYKKLSKLLL